MATRALIGTIETDAAGNQVLTSTYNHYDGYPESLGVALNGHYDEPQLAKQISNQGYISFLDPETGAIDAKHKESADKFVLPDDFEEAMQVVHNEADEMGADYVYLYDFDAADWLDSRNESKAMINKFRGSGVADQFTGGYEDDSYEDDPDNPLGIPGDMDLGLEENSKSVNNENYNKKWRQFLNEGEPDVVGVAKSMLKDKENLDVYIDSLRNDVRLNGSEDYIGYDSDDWEEDYNLFIQDKMD
jgi:hypothetical protein